MDSADIKKVFLGLKNSQLELAVENIREFLSVVLSIYDENYNLENDSESDQEDET